jgi:hypothetical protein
MDPCIETRRRLIKLLQMAYSGEKSAALAYEGHSGSVRNEEEKLAIALIAQEEWEHRQVVGQLLASLGEGPNPWREAIQTLIGYIIKPACYLSGWFFPMLGAWLLEEMNVNEYATAQGYAQFLGLLDFVAELEVLSVKERSHADYFKAKSLSGQGFMSKAFVQLFQLADAMRNRFTYQK